jgi:hypothetical protein
MEQYYDYRMTDERSVVEQAHEIQSLAKELEQFKCTLSDKFMAGDIIAKLPPSTTRKMPIAASVTAGAPNFRYAGGIYYRRTTISMRRRYSDIAGESKILCAGSTQNFGLDRPG